MSATPLRSRPRRVTTRLLLVAFVASCLPLEALADTKLECAQRARAVAARLRARAEPPMTAEQYQVAYEAAYATCMEVGVSDADDTVPVAQVEEPEEPQSAWDRFWGGLFSLENKKKKKRHGKYTVVVDDDD